jgi:hypothetical protein
MFRYRLQGSFRGAWIRQIHPVTRSQKRVAILVNGSTRRMPRRKPSTSTMAPCLSGASRASSCCRLHTSSSRSDCPSQCGTTDATAVYESEEDSHRRDRRTPRLRTHADVVWRGVLSAHTISSVTTEPAEAGDHGRPESVVRTGRTSSSLGREPDRWSFPGRGASARANGYPAPNTRRRRPRRFAKVLADGARSVPRG